MLRQLPGDSSALRRKQSAALIASIVLCWLMIAAVMIFYAAGRFYKDDIVIYDKVNPNQAPLESLVRLAGVGPATGNAIIQYRLDAGQGNTAFTKPADLQAVRGIGPKTVEKIKPWLYFQAACNIGDK